MKKLSLGLFVLATFIIYSVHQRREGSAAVVAPSTKSSASSAGTSTSGSTKYKDGRYVGDVTDALYGDYQVAAIISGGKLTDIEFLKYPNDRNRSISINNQSMPYLKDEAIQAQNANVDVVSGATDSSDAFIQSLGSALKTAQAS
jgi:uncharacterized protein with FMN-binding domain